MRWRDCWTRRARPGRKLASNLKESTENLKSRLHFSACCDGGLNDRHGNQIIDPPLPISAAPPEKSKSSATIGQSQTICFGGLVFPGTDQIDRADPFEACSERRIDSPVRHGS